MAHARRPRGDDMTRWPANCCEAVPPSQRAHADPSTTPAPPNLVIDRAQPRRPHPRGRGAPARLRWHLARGPLDRSLRDHRCGSLSLTLRDRRAHAGDHSCTPRTLCVPAPALALALEARASRSAFYSVRASHTVGTLACGVPWATGPLPAMHIS